MTGVTRRLWYCDHYAIPLPDGHKFPMAKYRMVRDLLDQTGLFRFECAPVAAEEVVALAHDPEYVRSIVQGTAAPAALRRIGFPWSPALVLRSLASVGGTLQAASDALETGWGGNLAGGTHHAFRAEGSGFCVFNDMAIAIQYLRSIGRIRRAAIVDLDVHQGDGTAAIFSGDPEILTLSLHGEKNFPFRKQQSVIDVALPDGTGDEAYLEMLASVLPSVVKFRPDMVYFQSGVDALSTDTLGRLSLTAGGLRRRDEMVLESCRGAGMPVVIVLGGGYSKPIERTAEAHAQTFQIAAAVYSTSALNSSFSVR